LSSNLTAETSENRPVTTIQAPARPGAGDAVFVWLVWAAMLGAAFYLVHKWGIDAPRADDLLFEDVLTGQRPATWSWFWEPHYEHIKPLTKLLMLASFRLAGGSYLGGMYFDTGALGLTAAILILAARKLRGWTAYTDAFFPLVMLHWGHSENFLWLSQVGFVITTLFAGIILALIVHRAIPSGWDVVGIAGAMAALALSGATGLALLPPLALWVVLYGLRRGYGAGALAVAGLIVLGLFIRYALKTALTEQHEVAEGAMHTHEVMPAVRAGFEFASTAFGALIEWWRWMGVVVVALWFLALVIAVWAWIQGAGNRWRISGVVCFLLAVMLQALMIGWGRGKFGPGSVVASVRYSVLPLPIAFGVYMAYVAAARGSLGHWLQILVLLISAAMLWPNGVNGMRQIRSMRTAPSPRQRWSELLSPSLDDRRPRPVNNT
jgi:hypothetical protein